MEYAIRLSRYLRTPLILCGTSNSISTPQTNSRDLDDVPRSFYNLFGRNWHNTRTMKRIFTVETILDESIVETISKQEHRPAQEEVLTEERRLFDSMHLPILNSSVHQYTENIDMLLNVGKQVVPFILHNEVGCIESKLKNEYEFIPVGSAKGEGFTCHVYRKELELSTPLYIITGELNISVDEFHALACDIDFRHKWDDQFHEVESTALDGKSDSITLRWVVKWPWPLAPREYNYVLTPHSLDDGSKLVMSASVYTKDDDAAEKQSPSKNVVPVKEYFGITAAVGIGEKRCRYCVFHFDDPRVGKMPKWVESYVSKTLLPSFPKNILAGARLYPKERLVVFTSKY